MIRLICWMVLLGGLISSDAIGAQPLDQMEFTRQFAVRLLELKLVSDAEVIASLEVRVEDKDGKVTTAYLDNAYRSYVQAPENLDSVIQEYVRTFTGSLEEIELNKDRLLPIIKDNVYISQVQEIAGDDPKNVFAQVPFMGDLGILFAFDEKNGYRFAKKQEVAGFASNDEVLLQLAIRNLEQSRPEPRITSMQYLAIVDDAGAYGSSLILLNDFWEKFPGSFRENLAVFPVSRDMLIVTGSEETEGLLAANEATSEWIKEMPYVISDKPIVRRNGKWIPFLQ